MLAGIAVLTVWVPRRVGHIIDALVAGTLVGAALWWEVAILLAMGIAIYLLRVGWRLALFRAAYQMGRDLRTELFARLALQAPAYFHRVSTGELMASATNDVDAVEMAAGEAFLAGFDGTLTLVLVVAMMTLGIDWRLGLAVLLPFPFMGWAFYVISRRVHEASRQALDRFSDLNAEVQESITAVRTLRALGLVQRAGRDFADRAQAATDAAYRAQRWESAFEPAVGIALAAATMLTFALGGWLAWRGEVTIGTLTAFTMYLVQLIWPMFAAGWVLSLVQRGKAAWARLDPVLRAPLGIADTGSHRGAPEGTLRAEAVTFRYPGTRALALADIEFTLTPGRTLGIVGPTGAGKSTLLQLILRHAEPADGHITWGGVALPDFTLAALRAAIAWVPQEAFLFSATIAENIALAHAEAASEEVTHAARLADLDADVRRFPDGYATRVGERGVTLSGGQRQRVAIARALLAEAPLLLLDDALSAVDTGTEARILTHLRTARAGRTAIIVSHRLSAVADADEIFVLKAGRIVERGDHAALLRIGGWYAAQWRYQQLEATLEAL
ncbi:MAG: ATP-binding cassette domain-containing protein [Burkholderiales bacterium]|nr:ATP-binding cassette domain-containing protein [Burkholderiales bacterium]